MFEVNSYNSVSDLSEDDNVPESKKNLTRVLLISIIFILILVAFFMIGAKLFFHGNTSDTNTGIPETYPTDTPVPTVTPTKAPTPTPASDDMANWKTYTSAYLGASFRYPPEWTQTITQVASGVDEVTLESPEGLIVDFSPEIMGLGQGVTCEPATCPVVKTRVVSKLPNTKSPIDLYLVEGSVDTAKRIGLMSIVQSQPMPIVGETKTFPYYMLFNTKKNEQGTFVVNASRSQYLQMPDDIFFALPEVKMAEMIISSFRYN